MSKKDFLKRTIMSFFMVVTLINAAMAIMGSIYDKDNTFSYEAFYFPLIYGVLGVIPSFITYSKYELTVKQMILRKFINLVLLEVLLISFLVINSVDISIPIIIAFAVSVFCISILVQIFLWLLDNKKAQKLTMELAAYQKKYTNGTINES